MDLPDWVDFNLGMNVVLMKDMSGYNLPQESDMDIWRDVILRYAKIQKDSITHIPFNFVHYDRTIDTIVGKLHTFPEKVFEFLKGTQNELTPKEVKDLKEKTTTAAALLESIRGMPIPNTIHHGDIRPGNIRVVGDNYIFYDWAWGGVSHPFVEIVAFLNVIRRALPYEAAKEMLRDTYLQEWLSYGAYDELKYAFSVLDILRDLFFALDDYDWAEAVKLAHDIPIHAMSADGWLAERRGYYFVNVVRRFLVASLTI